ncbi:hypothetical protein EXIGLDRAFT_78742 [Exidia glandulosa HHB12029]|uniref:Flavodoxin-like domain-containing protein n=1 Tax=Exidia glandulosa HHB12029 TaxID=1314781 RepID=A0A165HPD1_EXIGL|nr:hypothetical protein EXIGLDRAFT_78742 [Exidia glandulosa HHB12029]
MTTLDKSPLMGNYAASHPGEKALFLIVCCSYNGEAPDNAVSFDEMLENAVAEKKAELFANVKYTVFGVFRLSLLRSRLIAFRRNWQSAMGCNVSAHP